MHLHGMARYGMQMLVVPQIVQMGIVSSFAGSVPDSDGFEAVLPPPKLNVCVSVAEPPRTSYLTRLKSKNGNKFANDRPIAVHTTKMLTYWNDNALCV